MTFRRFVLPLMLLVAVLHAAGCGDDDPVQPDLPPPVLYGIGGWTEFDQFAVGERGTVLHYRGTEWRGVSSGTGVTLRDVVGHSVSNAIVGGDCGAILSWEGTRYTSV
jgi:hypothetical protein